MTDLPMSRGARALELLIFRVLPSLLVAAVVIGCLYWFASCRDTVAAAVRFAPPESLQLTI